MNCHEFESVVLAQIRKQAPDTVARKLGEAHMETCPGCSNRFAEEQLLFAGVRSVMAELAKQAAPANVEAALLHAFRQHVAQTTSSNVVAMPIKRAHVRTWKLAAAAAGLLILLSGMALFLRGSNAPNREKEVLVEATTPAPSLPNAGNIGADHRDDIVATGKATQRQPRPRAQAAPGDSSEEELVTEFFPLVEGHDVDSLEGSQIVRVELPSSALIAVGLPGSAASSGEVVEADVVLGPDGLARAIRFVRSEASDAR